MALSILTPDPLLDEQRRSALRRMRGVALGLLLFAAVVYLLTTERDGFLGFVNAGAEASMVGAIADWFAVTALFRHPLGLPIPHTALIPKRKEMLGRSLEEFVGENFLAEQVIRERAAAVGLSQRVGEWLAEPANATRVVLEAADVARIGLKRISDDDIAAIVNDVLVPRMADEPLAPVLGSLLSEVVADGAHQGLVDLLLTEAHHWLSRNEEVFVDVLSERAPWWAPPALNDKVTRRVHLELLDWLEEIGSVPDSPARSALDKLLADIAEGLLHDPATQERAENLKRRMLEHPQVAATATSLWNAFRRVLVEALADDQGLLVQRLVEEVRRFAHDLLGDVALQQSLDARAVEFVVFAVERYGGELTAVITHTIDRWDGKEAADKIELHVGKDLQFIRINGTIVGGLVGVLIHTVTVALG
jgi:uncharacterized membrane-anchored protein YjiN (DUF445 family)